MIHIKTQKEIETMRKGGKILADTLWEVLKHIKPGISELEIDSLAQKLIIERGGEPGFKKVEGYKHTICVSTNDAVVHGIPTNNKFKEGDVVGVDCGVFLEGFHTDMSETIIVGSSHHEQVQTFLDTGKKALVEGIKQARIGNHIGNISETIQDIVEKNGGYSVVRGLVGHGVGHDLHEDPEVPGFLIGKIEKTPLLKEGMVIAVEVIYNMGGSEMILDDDGWTLRTKDGKLSGLFERTIGVTKNGPLIITD